MESTATPTTMRIRLVYYGDLDTVTGGNLYDRKLIDHLQRHSIEIEHLSIERRPYLACLAHNGSSSLLERLREKPPDLLLQDELVHPSVFRLNRRLGAAEGRPLVTLVHHLRSCEARGRLANAFYRLVERLYLSTVDGFIFNSEATRKAVAALLAMERPYVVATPGGDRLAGVITQERVRDRARKSPLRLLFVGNLTRRKGLHHLLRALEDLRHRAWRLDVAGSEAFDARYTTRVRRRAARLGDRVHFHGEVRDAELARLFESSHLLSVPSSYEGFGIVYLEALGWGLPVIASAAGGAADVVRPSLNGYLLEPGNTTGLTRILESVIEDRGLLTRLSLGALESYQAHPNWEQSMTSIRGFLLELLEKRCP